MNYLWFDLKKRYWGRRKRNEEWVSFFFFFGWEIENKDLKERLRWVTREERLMGARRTLGSRVGLKKMRGATFTIYLQQIMGG